jgi:hypothetical protein
LTNSLHSLSITTFIKLNNNNNNTRVISFSRKSTGLSFRYQLRGYCIIHKHWCYHRSGSTSDAKHHVHHKSDHVVSQAIRFLRLILNFLLLDGQSPNIVLCRLQLFPLTPLSLKASGRHSRLSSLYFSHNAVTQMLQITWKFTPYVFKGAKETCFPLIMFTMQ